MGRCKVIGNFVKVCPFCEVMLDHADRCDNRNCFMWFTIVPLPERKRVTYEVRNACGEVLIAW